MSWADTRAGGRHHGPFGIIRGIAGLSWPDLPAPARMRRVAVVAAADGLRDVLVRVADAAAVEFGPPVGETAAPAPAEGAATDGEAARRLRRSGHPAPAPPWSRRGLTWTHSSGPAATICWPGRPSWRPTRPARSGGPARVRWPAGCPPARSIPWRPAWPGPAAPSSRFPSRAAPSRPRCWPDRRPSARCPPGPDVRHGTVRRRRPDLARLGELRADVRHDVRRRRRRPDAGGGRDGAAGGLAAVGPPVPAGMAVRRGRRRGGHRVRRAVRGVLRADRRRARGVAESAGPSRHALLVAAAGLGAIMLAGAYALGTVNRWREGGWASALYAPSGVAGTALYLGAGLIGGGWYLHRDPMLVAGALVAVAGLALAATGFVAGAGGGATGWTQAVVELFDLVDSHRLQRGLVHQAGRLRPDSCRAEPAGMGGHPCPVAAGRRGERGRGRRVRGGNRAGVRPGGARRRRPGAAPGVLRAVLAGFRDAGTAVQAVARAGGGQPAADPTAEEKST